jgi:hypothetical protein
MLLAVFITFSELVLGRGQLLPTQNTFRNTRFSSKTFVRYGLMLTYIYDSSKMEASIYLNPEVSLEFYSCRPNLRGAVKRKGNFFDVCWRFPTRYFCFFRADLRLSLQ